MIKKKLETSVKNGNIRQNKTNKFDYNQSDSHYD